MRKDTTIEYIENFLSGEYTVLERNLEFLLKDYKRKTVRLEKIIKQSDRQQLITMKLNDELNEYKNHLEEKVEEEIAKRQEKEKILLQQSKMAAMGEMIDAVAHQWRQPINIIKMQIDMMKYDFEDNMIDTEYIDQFEQKIAFQIEHMNNTLHEFRNFFRPNKLSVEFDIEKMIRKVLLLVKDEFLQHNIEFTLDVEKNFTLIGVENEFKHLIINIINNAKDALLSNAIENKKIFIRVLQEDDVKIIEIEDNAGGIPENIIDTIFNTNFSTKEEGHGTGIGLYICTQIAAKHNGTLSVQNEKQGAKFIFKYLEETRGV